MREPDERFESEGRQGRHQDEHEPERDDVPTDQRAGGREVGILRRQIEEGGYATASADNARRWRPATASGTTVGVHGKRTGTAE
jgi:hypothetical protein